MSNPNPTQTPPKKNNRRKWVFILGGIGAVVLLCCGLSVVGSLFLDTEIDPTESTAVNEQVEVESEDRSSSADDQVPNEESDEPAVDVVEQSEPTMTAEPTQVPEATPTPLPPAPPIEEIVAAFSDMTDAQRNRYNETVANTRIENWEGTIEDVDEGEIFGGFTIYVEMIESNLGSEVHIDVEEEVALSLSKGQTIQFSGVIDSVGDFLGPTVFVKDAEIILADGSPIGNEVEQIVSYEIAPPIEEIVAAFSDMTDAQRNRYNDSIAGSQIQNWEGTVEDVDEGELFGGFTVFVEMVPGNFGAEVYISVDEDTALTLNKGAAIVFSGTVSSVEDLLGPTVFVEGATIDMVE